MHALEGRRPLAHDETTGARLADESGSADRRMLCEELARTLADTVHQIHHARRNSGLRHDLREQCRGERAPLGGFVHNGAPGRERGRNLPRRQHEGCVPGRNNRHRSDRLSRRVVQMLCGRQRQPIRGARSPIGKKTKIFGGTHSGAAHEAQRLSRIHTLDERNLLAARLYRIRNTVKDGASLIPSLGTPGRESRFGRSRGCMHILLVARDDLVDHTRIDRRDIVEDFATGAGLRLAGNEMTERATAEAFQEPLRLAQVGFEITRRSGHSLHLVGPLAPRRASGASWDSLRCAPVAHGSAGHAV